MGKIIFPNVNLAFKAKGILEDAYKEKFEILKCHGKNGCGYCIYIKEDFVVGAKKILDLKGIDYEI